MHDKELLIDLLASKDLSQPDKVLLILESQNGVPTKSTEIVNIGVSHGLRQILSWNVHAVLAKIQNKGHISKLPDGWILTGPGRIYVQTKFSLADPASTKETALNLRIHLEKISNPDTREFVEEAIACLEAKQLKSAVVMSWVGAISVLYDFVLANKLTEFNARAKVVKKDWKEAITKDDLAKMKESDFLDILAYLSILGGNVKEDLKNNCLNLRNSCGHPSSFKVGKHKVEAHIETLIQNVFEKF